MSLRNLFLFGLVALMFTACSDDEDPVTTESLTLNISGLEDLGSNFTYEGWIIVDGAPISTGTFDVDANGALSSTSFDIDAESLEAAATFVLTIEPRPDNDPAPSAVHVLAGDFSGSNATLDIAHAAAIGTDFADATGEYILATPTDGMNNNELSGVWWLNPADGPGPGMTLPTLADGWKYEGWAVIDGTPVSTGTFLSANGADDNGSFSGSMAGPPYPGEDFLVNAPDGLNFPTDLTGATVVISVEPSPDNSPAPFLLKPLVGGVPANAADHTVYGMENNASNTNPTGSVNRK